MYQHPRAFSPFIHRIYQSYPFHNLQIIQDKTGELALVRDASNVTGIFSIARSSTVPSCAVASPTSPHQPAWKPSSHNASPSQNHSRASSMPQYTTIRATVAAAAAAATAAAKIAKAAKGGAQVEDEGPVASAPPPVRRRPSTMAGRRASFCVLDESVEQQLPPRHGHKQCASTSSFFPPPPPLSGSPQALSHLASFRGTASHVIRAEGEPAPMSFSALAMQVYMHTYILRIFRLMYKYAGGREGGSGKVRGGMDERVSECSLAA